MKKTFTRTKTIGIGLWLLSLMGSAGLFAQSGSFGCPNADLSMGDFTNWVGYTGSCCPINFTNPAHSPTPGQPYIVNDRHTLETGGNDSKVAALSKVPPGYSRSARIGNSSVGAQAEGLSYTFTVTPQNSLFIYNFAVVLQDPSHSAAQQPRFELRVSNQNGSIIPCTQYVVAASASIPGFQSQSNIRWRDWTQVGISLLPQMGQQITIEARTGDCAASGHYGYAYLAADCRPLQINVDYCVGDTVASLSAPSGFANYEWRIQGNPTVISNNQTIVINNPVPGGTTYECVITSVMGCTATLSTVLNPIVPVASFTTSNLCNGTLQFTDQTIVPNSWVANWYWDFGDGTTGTGPSPIHTYTQPGNYNVTLIPVAPAGCRDTVTLPVTVPPVLSPAFSVSPNCGLTKQLTDNSTISAPGTLVGWNWDFGNGMISNQQNPSVTYAMPGNYNVRLVVTDNNNCKDTIQQTITVNAVPNANFTAPQTCHGQVTTFTNTSNITGNAPLIYQWNFGNGQNTSVASPALSYQQPGQYTVTLVATGPGNCHDTAVQTVNIVPTPVADFVLPPPCGLSGTITNTTTVAAPATISSYIWNLGNGTITNQVNPTTNYASMGTYSVTLTATSNHGCTNIKTQSYTVYGVPVAQFSAPQTCHGLPTSFTNQSVLNGGGVMTYQWDFGNGSNSTTQAPVYTYPQYGNYNVTLIATGPGGCADTVTNPLSIPPTPVASFTLPPACGLTGSYTNTSTIGAPGQIVTNQWNFGNGQTQLAQNPTHSYTSPGTYDVELIVISDQGCRDTVVQSYTVYSIPTAAFSAPQTCFGLPFQFTDQSTTQNAVITNWDWNFGDGNVSTNQNPVHYYATHGNYPVTLIVTGPGGCSDTLTQQASVPPKPQAAFMLPPSCGMVAPFTNQSTVAAPGIIAQNNWAFGDGNSSALQNPTHNYATNGTWNVSLEVVTDQNCRDTIVQSYTNYHWPVASFTTSNVCHNAQTPFQDQTNVTNGQVAQWFWSLGDGNYQQTSSFDHVYAQPGTYPIQMIVISTDGCADTATGSVTVYPNPVPDFSVSPVCRGLNSVFQNNSSILTGNIASYQWGFSNSGVPPTNMFSPSIVFPGHGTWDVTLIATSDYGCITQITKPVTVWPRPYLDFGATPVVGCQPLVVQFNNLSNIPGNNQITQWQWYFGDSTGSSAASPAHLYTNPGQYTVTLYAMSDKGCDTSITYTDYITVHPKPQADFSYEPQYLTAVSPQIHVMDLSLGASSWQYVVSDGNSYGSPDFLHTFVADSGTYYITLYVSNEFGCTDTTVGSVRILPDFTIFIPNSFTPNGDGMNETFRIHGRGIVDANLWIFNRWGEEIIHLSNLEPMMKGWDGTYNREDVKQGIYVYRAIVRDMNGKEHEFYGNVNLIR